MTRKIALNRRIKLLVVAALFVALALPLSISIATSLAGQTYLPMIYSAPLPSSTATSTATPASTPTVTPTATPTATPTLMPTPELLPNGDFEQGPVVWTQYSQNGWPLIVQEFPGGIYPYDGTWAAWMGGDNYEFALLQQQVVVPSSLPYLYYRLWINSVDVCGVDFGYIYVNGDLVETYDLCFTTGGWAQNMIDLRAYAGTQVLFQIAVQCDGQWASSLFLDHFAFHPVLTRSVPIVMETSEILPESLKRDVLDR